jgi:hypothetical protein
LPLGKVYSQRGLEPSVAPFDGNRYGQVLA